MRILDSVFEDDALQTGRLKKRYDRLQEFYGEWISTVKRQGELPENFSGDRTFNLKDYEYTTREWASEQGIKWGWDIPLVNLKAIANFDYARDNGNKYLLRESLHGFPIMNYVLKEGPFKVSKDAVFGPEDFHVVLQGDDGNLIYFEPDKDGLKSGRYVECLL